RRRRPARKSRRRRMLGLAIPDGNRRRQGARQGFRARRRASDRGQEKFSLPQRLRTRLRRRTDVVGLQGRQSKRQAQLRMWRIVRRMNAGTWGLLSQEERLAEMHDAPADSDAARELAAEIVARRGQLQATMDARLAELERNFVKWDQSPDENMLTLELKAILSSIAYLRTLIRDVDRALENSKAA